MMIILNRVTLIQILIYLINSVLTNYHTMHFIIYLFFLSDQHFMQPAQHEEKRMNKAEFQMDAFVIYKTIG